MAGVVDEPDPARERAIADALAFRVGDDRE
jgi:hypothetical protein